MGATAATVEHLVTDKINSEWRRLAIRPTPAAWAMPTGWPRSSLGDVLDALTWSRRHDPASADAVFIELLTRNLDGDELAGRLVLQVMIGRAIKLARQTHRPGRSGIRGDLSQLMSAAVHALWNSIATYPVCRRRRKVPVNLCMDALRHFLALIDEPWLEVTDAQPLDALEPMFARHAPAPAVELLDTLRWAVETKSITSDEASLLTRVYCPKPGHPGGALAVSRELGIQPTTVRQRCSRAASRLASAVRSDGYAQTYLSAA